MHIFAPTQGHISHPEDSHIARVDHLGAGAHLRVQSAEHRAALFRLQIPSELLNWIVALDNNRLDEVAHRDESDGRAQQLREKDVGRARALFKVAGLTRPARTRTRDTRCTRHLRERTHPGIPFNCRTGDLRLCRAPASWMNGLIADVQFFGSWGWAHFFFGVNYCADCDSRKGDICYILR